VFREVDVRRYVVPGDLAGIAENGDMRLAGRDSSVINSAGEKVDAEDVERILRQYPGVTDVVVPASGADYSDYKKRRVVVCVSELAGFVSAKPNLRWAREMLIEARRRSISAASQDC
jgi:acyl-CoA synthetase (AMP-forming)/AMP-acid ligase II